MIKSLTALKREIHLGTKIECLDHWVDAVRTDLPPLAGDVRTVIKTQSNAYSAITPARPGTQVWSYWPKPAQISFGQDRTWTVTYPGKGTATFRILDPQARP